MNNPSRRNFIKSCFFAVLSGLGILYSPSFKGLKFAEAMAKGALKKSGANIVVGITGIAGPAGGSEQKPLGLVYICVQSDKDCEIKRFVFSHGRSFVRLQAAQTALNMVRLRF